MPIAFRALIVRVGAKEPLPAKACHFRDARLARCCSCPEVGRGECSGHGADRAGHKISTRAHDRVGVDLRRLQLTSLRFAVSNRKVEVRNWAAESEITSSYRWPKLRPAACN